MWQGGNQLASITDGTNTYAYTYNSDGLRTSRTVNGVTTDYYWVDGKLIAQTTGENTILFRYDADGNLFSFNYNGIEYFYVLNTQGDVSALMDASGMTIAFYYYDAWDNIVSVQDYSGNAITSSSHIANINPIRYRGYYYDTEIEMYYLQSRYYSPELCRFISSDEIDFLGASGTVLGYNLFSYCENSSIVKIDPTGTSIIGISIGLRALVVVVGVIVVMCISMAIISSPGFQEALYNVGNDLQVQLEDDLRKIGIAYRKAVKMASMAKNIIEGIIERCRNLRDINNYRGATELHHIVAKKATGAEEARKVLSNVGIDYKKDSRNLIDIQKSLHRRLHTNQYYTWVNSMVIDAYEAAGRNKAKQLAAVESVLLSLKCAINSMNVLWKKCM